jgi:hypothetical protein
MRGAGLIQLMLALGINTDPPPEMFTQPVKEAAKLERRFRLERPSGKALRDSFYGDVAHAYQSRRCLRVAASQSDGCRHRRRRRDSRRLGA